MNGEDVGREKETFTSEHEESISIVGHTFWLEPASKVRLTIIKSEF
jgi:hypothetical protein